MFHCRTFNPLIFYASLKSSRRQTLDAEFLTNVVLILVFFFPVCIKQRHLKHHNVKHKFRFHYLALNLDTFYAALKISRQQTLDANIYICTLYITLLLKNVDLVPFPVCTKQRHGLLYFYRFDTRASENLFLYNLLCL